MIDKKNLVNQELEDNEDFDDAHENLIYSIRIHAEFYGYEKLMRMLKEYVSSENKEAYLETIDLNVNPELEKALTFGPSISMLEMIFDWLSILDVDFLVEVSKLINNEERATLFEGMIYMGISAENEEEEEEEEVS